MSSQAGPFPSRPVRAIVGYDAGGPLDAVARLVAQDMTRTLGQPVIVENKPGASGLIATRQLALAKPDGYTILFVPSTFVVNPLMMAKVPYRPLEDFVLISRVSTAANVLVTAAGAKPNSVRELIALARAAPEAVSFASSGIGGPAHLSGELLQARTATRMIHVPFKGSAPALGEVIAGRISYMFYPVAGLRAHVAAGHLKVLAVAGTRERIEAFPELPTMKEAGFPGFEDAGIWFGVVARAGTPKAIVDRLNTAIRGALRQPATIAQLKTIGAQPMGSTPQEFAAFVREDTTRWSRIIKSANIRLTTD